MKITSSLKIKFSFDYAWIKIAVLLLFHYVIQFGKKGNMVFEISLLSCIQKQYVNLGYVINITLVLYKTDMVKNRKDNFCYENIADFLPHKLCQSERWIDIVKICAHEEDNTWANFFLQMK